MKKSFLHLFSLVILLTLTQMTASCQIFGSDGKTVEEERTVEPFDEIEVSGGVDVFITQGESMSLKLKADEKIMSRIRTEVNGSTLTIKVDRSMSFGSRRKEAYITLTDLKGIRASGGCDIYAEKGLQVEELSLMASGGSDIEMLVKAKTLQLRLSGGSDADLEGEADQMVVKASGGSDVKASDLRVRDCELDISGGSDANVNVTESLAIEASGASDVRYEGDPTITRMKTSGGSDVNN